MSNEVKEPTNGGSFNYTSDLKVNEENKIIGGEVAYTINVANNPLAQENEIVWGKNPVLLKLVREREQDER